MFKNYEIIKENNEEVLYLYLDLSTEFAILTKSKKTTINKEITDYIKNNNIAFNGKKIVLIASGIILGTCLLSSSLLKPDVIRHNYNYTTNITTINNANDANTKNNNNNNIIVEDDNTPKIEISNNLDNTQIKHENINDDNIKSKNNKVEEQENNVLFENKENTQMVSIKRANGTISYMELEDYLIGVVAAEMPASFNIEALKAQAVAARTYAMKHIENNNLLTDTVSTQAYKDNDELRTKWNNNYNIYYNKIKQAIESTKGEVMYYNNSLINAFYHSTSNGITEDSSQVFGEYPYLKSVSSIYDVNVSSYLRTISLSYEEISNKLNIPVTQLSNIKIEKNSSNRVDKIIIDNNVYNGINFRTLLNLRSTDFDISLNDNDILITTRGYGHGVGMSQYGANEYAKKGWDYKKILMHYYTDITIKSL